MASSTHLILTFALTAKAAQTAARREGTFDAIARRVRLDNPQLMGSDFNRRRDEECMAAVRARIDSSTIRVRSLFTKAHETIAQQAQGGFEVVSVEPVM